MGQIKHAAKASYTARREAEYCLFRKLRRRKRRLDEIKAERIELKKAYRRIARVKAEVSPQTRLYNF